MNTTRKLSNTQGKTVTTPQPQEQILQDILLHTAGFKPEEVVVFHQVDTNKCVYMTYSDVKNNLPVCAKELENPEKQGFSLLSTPLIQGFQTNKWSNSNGLTHTNHDISRVLWVHISISRKDGSNTRLTPTHHRELGKLVEQATGYSKETGFNSVVVRWSGYSFHLSIPVEIKTPDIQQTLELLQNDIREKIPSKGYLIETSCYDGIGIIGLKNHRFPGKPADTVFHGTPPTPELVVDAREGNTKVLLELYSAGSHSLPNNTTTQTINGVPNTTESTNQLDDDGDLADFDLPHDIEQIAQDIGKWNHKYAKSCDRAAAMAIFSDMVGRSVRFKDNTYCNLNLVLVAESSFGKGAGGRYVNALAHQIAPNVEDTDYNYPGHIITVHGAHGSMTIEGLGDRVYEHGEIFIIGDESEELVLPDDKNSSAASKTRDIRNKLAAASTNSPGFGRAKANGGSRVATTVPYVTEYHTTQPAAFYPLLANNHVNKGYLARIQIWRGGTGARNFKVNQTITNFVTELAKYWYDLKRMSNDPDMLYYKGSFDGLTHIPCYGASFVPKSRIVEWGTLEKTFEKEALRIDANVQKHHKNGEHMMANYVSKDVEALKRYALLFTLGADRDAREITPRALEQSVALIELKNKSFQKNFETYTEDPAEKMIKSLHNKIWNMSKNGTETVFYSRLLNNLPNCLRMHKEKVREFLWQLHNDEKIGYTENPKPAFIVVKVKP